MQQIQQGFGATLARRLRDRSFFMGRGAGGFWGGHPKIFELKGGAHPKS